MGYSEALEQQVKLLRSVERGGNEDPWWPRPNTDPESVKNTNRIQTAILQRAVPFYWHPSICSIISSTKSRDIDSWVFEPDRMPLLPAGFFWLAQPADLPLWDGDGTQLRAVAWEVVRSDRGFSLQVVTYHHFWGISNVVGDGGAIWWYQGESLGELIQSLSGSDAMTSNGYPIDPWEIEALRWFATAIVFIEQRLLAASAQRAERHAAKRLVREGWTHEPLIRVVELRRKAAQSKPSEDPKTVEWTHQWVVSGHWRQQPYPSLGIVQPKWIMPYVKGPEDKPLSPPRAKVFAVVR